MSSVDDRLMEVAKSYGFDEVDYVGKRGVFNVYSCGFKNDIGCVGLPVFLLENGGEIKVASERDTMSIMSFFSDRDD